MDCFDGEYLLGRALRYAFGFLTKYSGNDKVMYEFG